MPRSVTGKIKWEKVPESGAATLKAVSPKVWRLVRGTESRPMADFYISLLFSTVCAKKYSIDLNRFSGFESCKPGWNITLFNHASNKNDCRKIPHFQPSIQTKHRCWKTFHYRKTWNNTQGVNYCFLLFVFSAGAHKLTIPARVFYLLQLLNMNKSHIWSHVAKQFKHHQSCINPKQKSICGGNLCTKLVPSSIRWNLCKPFFWEKDRRGRNASIIQSHISHIWPHRKIHSLLWKWVWREMKTDAWEKV